MSVQKTDQASVIGCALALFRRQGYHKTSMAEVAAACGLLKGSLYHYFPSKEAMARAVMDHVHARFAEAVFRWADDHSLAPDERLRRMMAATEEYFLNGDGGCVMGNLAIEVTVSAPELSLAIRAYFADWAAALARILGCRWDAGTAQQKAERAVAEIQGALLLMRASNTSDALLRTTRGLVQDLTQK
ncbi:MAG: TetR/AcrR family transcriptional regulator [Solirubrobacterales bacterium]